MTNLSPQVQAIVNAFDDEYYQKATIRSRALVDELSYRMFLPGNDCRVIDTSSVYKISEELEQF